MRPLLFNPGRASGEELEATLVARGPLLDELQRALIADAAGPSVRHWLIVAPRGSGKSHVTELLARRMRQVPGWSVVRMPEEAYRVHRVADLLAWVVGAVEGVARPFSDEDDPARVEALAEARLRRWRAERGPVLVLVENFHDLLGRRFDRKAQARLRTLLMGDPPFVLVATATRMFAEVTSHGAPFYDFFQERRLDELSAGEVAELVENRARFDGAQELLERLDEVRPRLAALHHLSGGNPRLVVALYGVLRQGLTRELYEQLLQLLDDVTPYYQARLRDASPQGERVLAEMAMAEGPMLPSELGRRCGLKTNQVTAVLAQLQEERFVRPGGRPRDKRARYWEVTDRLFRAWLQMREDGESAETMQWVVEFYRRWYSGSAKLHDCLVEDVDLREDYGVGTRRGHGTLPSLAHGVTVALDHAHCDADLAQAEAVMPEGHVLLRSLARGLRAWAARRHGWPFDSAPPLDAAAVRAAWESPSTPFLRAFGPLAVHAYVGLRDLGALDPRPPWIQAARVLDADDRDAELAALHPEVREAVELLLGGG